MKLKFIRWSPCAWFFCCATVFHLSACVSGPGGFEGSTGTALLSLKLKDLHGGLVQSADGFDLQLDTFALAFSQITLGGDSVTENFAAEFCDEEATGVVAMESVPGGAYDSLSLELAPGEGLGGPSLLKGSAVDGEVTSSLNGNSVLILANASSPDGKQHCNLRVELQGGGSIAVGNEDENTVTVTPLEDVAIPVEVDAQSLFANVHLSGLCVGGAELLISPSQNPEQAQAILGNILGGSAFQLQSSGD